MRESSGMHNLHLGGTPILSLLLAIQNALGDENKLQGVGEDHLDT